uniref:AcidPPc domain-containing protein n=1 Tax=Strongyloides stercoralis TaxID=6248 RepID=A0A0K0EM76_STRER
MIEEQVDSNNYGTMTSRTTENEMEDSPTLLRKMMVTIKQPILFNVLIFIITFILFLLFQLWIEPTKRGFFCNDETIRYPFKQDTVTPNALIIFSVLPNILMVFYGEKRNALNRRHRPYFLDVCKPDVLKNATCSDYNYILNYTCTGTNLGLIRESSLSFPSGHSAIAFYAATFFYLYIQNRTFFMRKFYLLPSALQFTGISLATFTAVSRIFDYHHHPEDVAIGTIIGILFGYYFYNYNISIKKKKHISSDIDNDTSSNETVVQNDPLLRNEMNV